jgi:hypothetical protein
LRLRHRHWVVDRRAALGLWGGRHPACVDGPCGAKANSDDERQARNLASARRIVRELVPLADTFGETYFAEERGIDTVAIADVLERCDAIGWHSAVYFSEPDPEHPLHAFDGQRLWCIVGVMTDAVTARPTGAISRTYLDSSTGKKVGKAKTLGVPAGVIRLSGNPVVWKADEHVGEGLHLAEGLETALAAMAIGLRPMWCCGSTPLMAKLPVLAGIECLTLIADHDANGAGEKAAYAAAERWRHAGREVHVLRTRELGDFNDGILRRGAA